MRVLVADESATLRDGAAQVLREAGHEVLCAEDGLQAWELSERPLDAAFISSSLGRLDALQLLSLWRQHGRSTGPVVILVDAEAASALRSWNALTGRSAEESGVLRRPFSPSLLVDLLESLRS